MTNKEAIEHLRELKTLRIEFLNASQEQALDMAMKALDIYKTFCPVEFPTEDDPYPVCSYTRQQGEWIDEYWEDAYQESYHTCSICKKDMRTTHYDNFCPNCGADMRKPQTQKFADNDTAYGGLASAT